MDQKIQLSENQTIPATGYGTWRLGQDIAAQAVESAISAGYRHLDCAKAYSNEKQVGEGIANALRKNDLDRKELFITGKLWNTDHDPDHVEEACMQSIEDLGVEYLDLYLIHWPIAFEYGEDHEPLDEHGRAKLSFVPLQKTWEAMEDLVDQGLVKSIGVSNFNAPQLIDLLSYAKVKPVMNQIELHPYHAQTKLIEFCKALGVAVAAYSPLGSAGAPVIQDPVIQKIAAVHPKTSAQITLRWGLQRGTVVIAKTFREDRINENFDIFDFDLTPDEMQALNGLDQKRPLVDPIEWWGIPYF